jgi:hypothetical protein
MEANRRGAPIEYLCRALEPVTFAHEMIDHVHLNVGVPAQIGDGPGRADVGEDRVLIVQDANGPLRGKVRRAVGADCSNESQPSPLYQLLRLIRQFGDFYLPPSRWSV